MTAVMIYGHDPELRAWAGKRLGMVLQGAHPTGIGVARGGKIIAAALFCNYQPPTIEVTFVTDSPRWASRQVIGEILRFPFVQLGCKRMTAVTERTNVRARRLLEGLGFRLEGVHPDAFPSGVGLSYGLLKADAERWLR